MKLTTPKPKGHWPKGKRRHADTDAAEVVRLLNLAAARRQQAQVARRLGVPVKTIWRWRTGIDVPSARVAKRLGTIIAE